jgi:hypothetical protein
MSSLQNLDLAARLATAKNPITPANTLAKLASDREANIRKAVVENPNTPIDSLEKLGQEFPDELTENPIFTMLFLENPESQFVRIALARSTKSDENTLTQLSKIKDEEILCAVAQNPKTPLRILEELTDKLISNYHGGEYPDEFNCQNILGAIAQNPQVTESLLIKLSNVNSDFINFLIAENPKVSASLLDRFADYKNSRMHQIILQNDKTLATTLEKLAGEESSVTREMVRCHPNVSELAKQIINFMEEKPGTPIELLENLAADPRHSVRRLVAIHPKTSARILEKLAQDSNCNINDPYHHVLYGAARNINASSTVLEIFSKFLVEKNKILYSSSQTYTMDAINLVEHHNVTEKVLRILLSMKHCDVIRKIASSPKTPRNILVEIANIQLDHRTDYFFQEWLARNPNTPAEALERLATIGHVNTMPHIACHKNVPVSVLKDFASQATYPLCSVVAQNPRTPAETLRMLAYQALDGSENSFSKNINDEIAVAVARNVNAPVDLLLTFMANKRDRIRAGVAGNLNAPISLFEILANDSSQHVRWFLASNHNVPAPILEILLSNDNDLISVIAENPNITQEMLYSFAQNPTLHARIALHPKLPLDLMKQISTTEDHDARQKIATRDDLPLELELELSRDQHVYVRRKLLQKPSLSEMAIQNIAEVSLIQFFNILEPSSDTKFLAQEKLALQEISQHLKTSTSVLERITFGHSSDSSEPSEDIRLSFLQTAIAKHPNTSFAILEKLASKERHTDVSIAARESIKRRF